MDRLISVIIPVYNKEAFIEKCVNSVLSQTYSNVEIILVNDGSKDSSASVCEKIAENNHKVILINQENQGVSVARNNGIEKAGGDYVFFLDADDFLPPDSLASLLKAAQEHDADLTIGKYRENEDISICFLEGEDFLRKSLEDNPIAYSACRMLYKREFIRDLRFPKGRIAHEDSYFTFLCALKMPKVATVNAVVYNYVFNSNSASNSHFTIKKYDDICELLAEKEKYISENHQHLLPLFYHLKTKIYMSLLSNLALAEGAEFRKKEKEVLANFNEVKGYYQANLPCSNASFYNIVAKKMYYPYKAFLKFKKRIKHLLRR